MRQKLKVFFNHPHANKMITTIIFNSYLFVATGL